MPEYNIPEFPEGTRFYIWKASTYSRVSDLCHVVLEPRRSRVFTYYFTPYPVSSHDHSHVRQDQLQEARQRSWQEVTFEGFCLVMHGEVGLYREELSRLAPYLIGDTFVPEGKKSSKTNHKIGVPKGKLP